MALDVPLSRTIRPSQRLGLYATPSLVGPEGATQTFKKGAPLIASGGYLVVAAADATSGIIGFAEEDAHNDAVAGTHSIGYTPALPHVVFEAVLEDQANFNHVSAVTNRFVKYALQTDPVSLAWFLDENDTGNGVGLVVDFVDAVGTTKATVLFIVDISSTIYG